MAQASISVDVFNPGQVLACMGFLEASNLLLGTAVGGFEWDIESSPRFEIRANGSTNPFAAVLEFLMEAQIYRLVPQGYVDPLPDGAVKKHKVKTPLGEEQSEAPAKDSPAYTVETFPARQADRLALPLRLARGELHLDVTHWCDGSSRNSFKLFAGQQRSYSIAQQMIEGIRNLHAVSGKALIADPFGSTMPLGGSSFKLDPRKSWTAIDAGYSPDEQAHDVQASPVVEMLAAIGLENARPDEFETRQVRYGVWKGLLPLLLARPALAGAHLDIPMRVFRFTLDLAGKNKIVTFAQEETTT